MAKLDELISKLCPDGVEYVPIGTICEIKGRIGFRGYKREDQVEKGKGAISLSPSNITEIGIDYTNCTFINWAKYEESPEIKVNNGDIIFWNQVLETPFELSSMGIRVDKEALLRQLDICGCPERAQLSFHRALLNDELPLSIGGGIGQSRFSMFLLQKAHIGEVQASIWPEEQIAECARHNIHLL